MTLYDLNTDQRMENIRDLHKKIKEIKESLAEKRSLYRSFAKEINICDTTFIKCYDSFEYSLLVECYTFSEQLVKNLIYEMVQMDKNSNEYINKFINKKIPKDTFSPKVKFDEFQKEINSYFPEFTFTLNKDNDFFKKYDELVKARHRYAHKGVYDYDFQNFESVIQVLEYFVIEINSIINLKMERVKYQNEIFELKEDASSLKKMITDNPKLPVSKIKEKLKKIRTLSNNIQKKYSSNYDCELNCVIFDFCRNMVAIDLRKFNTAKNTFLIEVDKLELISQSKK